MISCDHTSTTSDNGLTRIEIKFGRGQNVNDKKKECQIIVKRILRKLLELYYREKTEKKKK